MKLKDLMQKGCLWLVRKKWGIEVTAEWGKVESSSGSISAIDKDGVEPTGFEPIASIDYNPKVTIPKLRAYTYSYHCSLPLRPH